MTDVVAYLALLTILVVQGDDYDSHTDLVNYFRRPYAGEELYRVTDVMALLRTSGRSTREMHAGGMKFTAAFQLVRHVSFF